MRYLFLELILLCCFGSLSPCAEAAEELLRLQTDADIQDRIQQVVEILVDRNTQPPEKMRAVGTLSEASKEGDRFFRLLFAYICQHRGGGDADEIRRLTAMKIADLLDVSEFSVARVVIPYIDHKDESVRGLARKCLSIIEKSHAPLDTFDYSHYRGLIELDKEHPPAQLVAYMYERSPGTAVLTLLGIYMLGEDMRHTEESRKLFREVQWSEHVVSDALWKERGKYVEAAKEAMPKAAAELEKLSRHEAWWVRLYVAEILRQHREFRTPELMERLRKDPHELVRRAIQQAEQPPGAKRTSESKAPAP